MSSNDETDDKRPWEAAGISRATWFRRKRQGSLAVRADDPDFMASGLVERWDAASEAERLDFVRKRRVRISITFARLIVPGELLTDTNQRNAPLSEQEARDWIADALGSRGKNVRDDDGQRLVGDRGSNPKPEKGGKS
jgi:hypothetical protein